MRTTFNVSFYCRPSKANRQGLSPLEMALNINQQRIFLNLPVKFSPADFNRKRKSPEIQSAIDTWRTTVNTVVTDLISNRMPITVSTVREYLRTGGVRSKTVADIWNEYMADIEMRVSRGTATGDLYNKYRLAMERTFSELGRNREICTIVNADMVRLYDSLRGSYRSSTATGYFTKIKTVFRYAIDNGYMRINPFNGIKVTKAAPRPEYLTESEIRAMETVELDGRLDKARNLLLFQLYSGGMAFCDCVEFNPANIREINGMMIYTGKRRKTGIEFTTVVLPKAMEIWNRYGKKMPYISNQKLNEYAKLIQRAAGINTKLTTHVMRKSFAQMMLRSGVRMETVARMLGHSNTRITERIYCRVNEEIVSNEVSEALKNLSR